MAELTESPGFPEQLHNELLEAVADNQHLRENLERVRQQYMRLEYDDANWTRILGGSAHGEHTGLTLDSLKTISRTLREEVAGSALPKRANEARYAYTFGKPFFIRGLDDQQPSPPKRGRKPALQAFYENESAQRHVFSDEAKSIMHAASSTDGVFLLVGDNRTKNVNVIPLHQIANVMTHPDHDDEVWAYLRKWDRSQFNNRTGVLETTTESEWIYTDSYPGGTKPARIGDDPVNPNKTIIDAVFNRQSGWTLGVPDLMAGQIWWKKYITMVAYGEQVTETLAYFAAKVKVNSKPGASDVGLKLGNAGREKGQVVAVGAGNDIDVFSSAGRAYDFTSLRIFSSFYAAAVGIPLTDLSADPSAAGASYGSAQALQPGARRLIEARRLYWAGWIKRVLKWATGDDITVTPATIEEEELYRESQRTILAWNSGLFSADEIRPVLARTAGVPLLHPEAPEGVLLPNNEASWQRADIDPKDDPAQTPETTAAPDQGQRNGTGGQDDSTKKDQRRDTIQNQ